MVLRERNAFVSNYHRKNRAKVVKISLFVVLAIVAVFASLFIGFYKISFTEVIDVIIGHITGNITNPRGDLYIFDYRLPRAIAAVLVGAVLAIGGAVMQNATNNPLAEPYTLGVSSAALLGATISMAFGVCIIPGITGNEATIIDAFIFSLIPVSVILIISSFKKLTPVGIILIGIALMYLFSSISQYIMVTASAETLTDIYNWRVGSLDRMEKNYEGLMIIAAITIPICLLISVMSKKLDLMYAGDKNAKTMGLNVKTFRIIIMSLVSLTTAAIVCFTGTIGFIGLVGPHVARAFVGSNNRYLIPCSAAFGGAFLVAADMVAKVSGSAGLPVGVISSAVGGPLFLYILIRHNRKVWN